MAISLPTTTRAAVECCGHRIKICLRSHASLLELRTEITTPPPARYGSTVRSTHLQLPVKARECEEANWWPSLSPQERVTARHGLSMARRPTQWTYIRSLLPTRDYTPNRAIHSTPTRAQQSSKPGGNNTSLLVRQLMRSVPHPVAVITATDPTLIPETSSASISKAWKGATVSSLNTVSLDPEAIVSFNIKRLSSTYDALSRSGYFNVHLMSESVEAEKIATRFAGGNAAAPFDAAEEEEGVQHNDAGRRKLAEFVSEAMVEVSAQNPSAPPVIEQRLKREDGKMVDVVAFRFLCQYLSDKTVSIGDSVVVFGKPVDIEHSDPRSERTGSCLSYVHGGYSRIAT